MDNLKPDDVAVIVLADGASDSEIGNNRGHLFERFAAQLLEQFGYEKARTEHLNVTSEGIEIDLVATQALTRKPAIVECKAYTNNVPAKEMLAFVGKHTSERFDNPNVEGYFICLPKLTQPGVEKARKLEARDASFHYLDADAVYRLLVEAKTLGTDPNELASEVTSDRTVIITEHGVYTAIRRLDSKSRIPVEVVVWSASGGVPEAALDLVRTANFASGLPCKALLDSGDTVVKGHAEQVEDLVVEVRAGSSDFEYQLPAAPKYFVGRRDTIDELSTQISSGAHVVVINAQSGWGKSSLALRLKASFEKIGGVALVLDSRTVTRPSYVASALRKAAEAAAKAGIVVITQDASWASLASAVRTLEASVWKSPEKRLLVLFDQFENVFREESVTREFRDLAVVAADTSVPLVIGFAWKTDVVGWTEGYPYQLRDSIRQCAFVASLDPLGPGEIGTLLRRLEKALGVKLLPELKVKIREYSQGLPWLMKKLGSHVISETERGVAQEDLVAEALNVQRLFENDLQELQPAEREALNWLAKYAPVLLSEALERFPAPIVQSLLDRRLLVQVGERLDTYWDIFRDFLTTGRVPIEDSYTLRVYPATVGRLLQALHDNSKPTLSSDLAVQLGWSESVILNIVREARVLGLVRSESKKIALARNDDGGLDLEEEIRARVSSALKRHKVYSTYQDLAERAGGVVSLQALAKKLPPIFPAIAASDATWLTYARAFAKWFDYAGLATVKAKGQLIENSSPDLSSYILDPSARARTPGAFPQRAPGPALGFLLAVAESENQRMEANGATSTAIRDLLALQLLAVDQDGIYTIAIPEIIQQDGSYSPAILLKRIESISGAREALAMLREDPKAAPADLGALLRTGQATVWSDGTAALAGKHFRAWANRAGVFTGEGARRPRKTART